MRDEERRATSHSEADGRVIEHNVKSPPLLYEMDEDLHFKAVPPARALWPSGSLPSPLPRRPLSLDAPSHSVDSRTQTCCRIDPCTTLSRTPVRHDRNHRPRQPHHRRFARTLSTQDVEARYRPYLATKNAADEPDWTAQLELDTVKDMVLRMRELQGQPEIKVLVLYGSLRERWVPSLCSRTQEHVADASAANPPPTDRSFSRLTAYEASRVLSHIGADVRVFDPAGLPIKDGVSEKHDKVVELRALSEWSDAQLWVSPEQHGTITAVMKNQSGSPTVSSRASLERGDELTRPGASSRLDPLVGWVGPSYTGPHARHLPGQRWQPIVQHGQRAATTGPVDAHVDGELLFSRKKRRASLADAHLTRPQIPNQSSLPKAWTQYTSSDRLMPSSNRDRLVDVCEELIKATLLLRPYVDLLGDRFSEREEKREHGRLRTQAETEAAKKASEAEKRKVDEQAKRGSEVA